MKIHELIEKLQKIPNQNMKVYVTNDLEEEELEDITEGYIYEEKVVFLDNYCHWTEPYKKPEPKPLTPMEAFWGEELVKLVKGYYGLPRKDECDDHYIAYPPRGKYE